MQELTPEVGRKTSMGAREPSTSQSPDRMTAETLGGQGLQGMSGEICTGKPKVPPLRVKSIKQITHLQFLAGIIKNAGELNFGSSNRKDSSIFNVDDLLVELAMLKTNKKLMNDLVFFFKVKTDTGERWQIKRSYDQILSMSKSLNRFGKKLSFTIPDFDPTNPELYKALTFYINTLLKYYENYATISRKIHIFLEMTSLRGQEVGTIIKAGWASKGIGGRYKTHKLVQFIKQNFACCWGKKYFILSEEGIGYTNEYNQKEFRDILFFDRTLRGREGEKDGESDVTRTNSQGSVEEQDISELLLVVFVGVADSFLRQDEVLLAPAAGEVLLDELHQLVCFVPASDSFGSPPSLDDGADLLPSQRSHLQEDVDLSRYCSIVFVVL